MYIQLERDVQIDGFDWDDGNWPKCARHGLSKLEIEDAIRSARFIVDDPHPHEPRLRAVGVTGDARFVFVAFTVRAAGDRRLIRPISARYMHDKEIKSYERNKPENR